MKFTTCLVIVVCFFRDINCWCRAYNPTPVPGIIFKPTDCAYKNETLALGETREIECLTVSCSTNGALSVCNNNFYYGNYPERCTQVKDGCKYKLVLKSDETKDCNIQPHETLTMIGR